MKKFLLFSIGLALPMFVFAAGVGGGGSGASNSGSGSATSNIGEGFLAPSVGSVSPPVTPEPTPPTPEQKPEQAKLLPPLRTHFCFTVPKLQQRIECRLGLSEQDLAAEYAKQYLPEECRALPKKQQADCVTRYKALQPCWEKSVGDERTACAKEVLAFPENLVEARNVCKLITVKKEKISCLTALQQKSYNLVKFRFYDLNERAEDFLKENPTVDGRPAMKFIVASELNKQRFNTARTKAQRLQIIRNERTAWQKFVRALRVSDAQDFLDDALAEVGLTE
ncbi:hypothetical protein HY625_02425 [Candidatus Uhrbacteria bacterium]|nr:hypothetical protein [Candidatus Uhrbacteria bacterium]